jgi:hypothetical protein
VTVPQAVVEFGLQIELCVLLSDVGIKRWPQRAVTKLSIELATDLDLFEIPV